MPLHSLEEQTLASRITSPCILVIFGATGDLTSRKLFPAIYNLCREKQLPKQFAVVGFARRDKTDEQFREEMKQAIGQFSRVKPIDNQVWDQFSKQIFYHKSEFHDPNGYQALDTVLRELDDKLQTQGNRVFYLSTQPSFFPIIAKELKENKLIYDESNATHKANSAWSRLIIEKPFGHDLESAIGLQKELLKFLAEDQIYRIDHYLGKETVQNLLVFRFANSLFESLWNNRYIDHVQITVAEEIGIGRRGAFFEEAGLLRDIVQNHMMQLLSLVAMEPPVSLSANAIRDEKVKVLQAIRPYSEEDFVSSVVRGQYGKGLVKGQPVKGYREEDNVNPESMIETFVALRLFIDNWRWHETPFYLRAGKRLAKRATEIAITFKYPPGVLFQHAGKHHEPNVLIMRIQPDEGISLNINCKVPGPASPIQPVKMDFRYGTYFGTSPPEAYERLILDCMLGDSTLFAREDEVIGSWRFFSPILTSWHRQETQIELPNYQSGTAGPQAAEDLIGKDHRKWRGL